MSYVEEDRVASSRSSSSDRRVKIEKNSTWSLRFLPVTMGKRGLPYIRIAQHWLNKVPTWCPRHISPDFGGDPEYDCPFCKACDELHDSQSDRVRDAAYRASATQRFRFTVVVFDVEDKRGNIEEVSDAELYVPWNFELYRTSWEKLMSYQKRALTRRDATEYGIFDLENGLNFLVTNTGKGIDLDKQEPSPIFKLDEAFDAKVKRVWDNIKEPKFQLPSTKQLERLAEKFTETALESAHRRRRDEDYDDDGDDDTPKSRRRRDTDADDGDDRRERRGRNSREFEDGDDGARSSRRARREPEQEADERPPRSSRRESDQDVAGREKPRAPRDRGEPQDQSEQQAPPTRRHVAPEDSGGNEAPSKREPETVKSPPPPRRTPASQADNDGDDDGDLGPQRRTTAPPATAVTQAPPARREISAPPARKTSAPAPAPVTSRGGTGVTQEGVDDEEDNAPEEAKDHAPALKDAPEEPPTPVNATAPAPSRVQPGNILDAAMQDRLNRVTRRDKLKEH